MAPDVPEPPLSSSSKSFLKALSAATLSKGPIPTQLSDFYEAENELRRKYAAKEKVSDSYANLIPVFHSLVVASGADKTKSRQSTSFQGQYICPLKEGQRRPDGTDSFVQDGLVGFKRNWDIFTEGALQGVNWNNVFAIGGAVVVCASPLPEDVVKDGPQALRKHFHEGAFAASDIDLYLYGLENEDAAKEKVKEIYEAIKRYSRGPVLCVRSVYAISIVCEWPQRHIQIVLRLYSSPAEIFAGVDVDVTGIGYNGTHVWAAHRAVISFVTQSLKIDMFRRSASYEVRLAKYAKRGYEIFFPELRREAIDPMIYERVPNRLQGLAKLLVVTALDNTDSKTKSSTASRSEYLLFRRQKRGRPALEETHVTRNRQVRNLHKGDLKAAEMASIFVSGYDTIHIPYGRPFKASKIQRLLYQRDLVLNGEWNPKNKPPERLVKLHRHPSFFGDIDDVFEDCCGFCPVPKSDEEKTVYEMESERYVNGKIAFVIDDPGKQRLGAFNPSNDQDWAADAYISAVKGLHSAVTRNDIDEVKRLLETCDVNKRDHTGRLPLWLAGLCGNNKIAKLLIEKGASISAVRFDGRNILHLASQLANLELIDMLLQKSKENQQLKEAKTSEDKSSDTGSDQEGFQIIERSEATGEDDSEVIPEEDILDINLPDWDYHFTPLHHAIYFGHIEVVKRLIEEGADPTIPAKVPSIHDEPSKALLPIVLCAYPSNGVEIAQILLRPGISTQTSGSLSAFHMLVLSKRVDLVKFLLEADPRANVALNHFDQEYSPTTPLCGAVKQEDTEMVQFLLEHGAQAQIPFEEIKSYVKKYKLTTVTDDITQDFGPISASVVQPLELAVRKKNMEIIGLLLSHDVDVNWIPKGHYHSSEYTAPKALSYRDIMEDRVEMLKSWLQYHTSSSHQDIDLSSDMADGTTFRQWVHTKLHQLSHPYPVNENKRDLIREELSFYRQLAELFVAYGAKPATENPDFQKYGISVGRGGLEGYFDPTRGSTSANSISFAFLDEPVRWYRDKTEWSKSQKDMYHGLFEFVWKADIAELKACTLSHWGETEQNDPLKVAVQIKEFDINPVTLALHRGRFDVARLLLQIANAQYRPDKGPDNYYIGKMWDSDEELDSEIAYASDREDTLRDNIISQRMDTFELGDVSQLPREVHTKVSPLEILGSPCNLSLFVNSAILESCAKACGLKDKARFNGNWVVKCLLENDFETFLKLWDLADEFKPGLPEIILPPSKPDFYGNFDAAQITNFDANFFALAIALGRLSFITETMKRTSAGIPFSRIESQLLNSMQWSSADETRNYYAGLRVRGKYRPNWLKKEHNRSLEYHSFEFPIAVLAAYYGNIDTLKWIFSDEPAMAIETFISKHPRDKRSKVLKKVGNWQELLPGWLGTEFVQESTLDNALHAAIAGKHLSAIQFVLLQFETQGNSGVSILTKKQQQPKHGALLLSAEKGSHVDFFIQLYLGLQDCENLMLVTGEYGCNLLHILVHHQHLNYLQLALNKLDEKVKRDLLAQRTGTTLCTPLALGVKAGNIAIVKLLLDQEEIVPELYIRDADGQMPIHLATIRGYSEIVPLLLSKDPAIQFEENTFGLIPLEIARHRYLLHSQTSEIFSTGSRYSSYETWPERIEEKDTTWYPKQENESSDGKDEKATLELLQHAWDRIGGSGKEREMVEHEEVFCVVERAIRDYNDPLSQNDCFSGSRYSESLWKVYKEDDDE